MPAKRLLLIGGALAAVVAAYAYHPAITRALASVTQPAPKPSVAWFAHTVESAFPMARLPEKLDIPPPQDVPPISHSLLSMDNAYVRQRLTDMFGENDPFSSRNIPQEVEVPVLPQQLPARPEVTGSAVAIGKSAEGKVRFNCGVRYKAAEAVIVTDRFKCGQQVAVTNPVNGKTVAATVAGSLPRYNAGNGMVAHTSLAVSDTLGLNRQKPVPVVLRKLEKNEDVARLPPLESALPFFARPREPKAEDVLYHARNILGECGNCPTKGKLAVIEVTQTRTVQNFLGARTVRQTVEKPSQFSWNLFSRDVSKVNSLIHRSAGKAAKALAARRLKDQLTADEVAQVYILKDADHYFACYITPPPWAYKMTIVGYDHPHIFMVNERPRVPHKRSDFSCRGANRVARS